MSLAVFPQSPSRPPPHPRLEDEMTLLSGSLFALLLAQEAPVAAPPPAVPPAPASNGPIATVNGEELELAGFEEWMVRAHGWRHLDDYIDLVLLRQEARRAGLPLPTAKEIDDVFELDWKDKISLRGDEAALLAELARAGMDKKSYRDRQLGTLEQETLGRRILKAREPSDETIHELYVKEFGKEGMRVHVRVAFFDRLKALKPGGNASKEEAAKMASSARERADAFFEQVSRERGQFAALVAGSDRCLVERTDGSPVDTRTTGGDVPRLHAEWLGGQVAKAIAGRKSGDLVPPFETSAGWYVVDLVESAPAPFAAVEAELREFWKNRVPSAGEVFWLKDELRKKAKIEKLGLHPPAR
jgi:hypothetical protein